MALALLVEDLAEYLTVQPEGQILDFMTINLKPSFQKLFHSLTIDEINFLGRESIEYDFPCMVFGIFDPYMEDFDWDGCSAESDPAYVGYQTMRGGEESII